MRNALAAHWRRKVGRSIALTLAFCVPYFALQHVVLVPVRRLPLSPVDTAIPFNPHWVWVYQSVYVLVSFVPWLADTVEDLDRYARGFLLQAYLGFVVFLFFPIAGPRPAAASGDPMFQVLLSYDSPLNSFPSLHVGLAAYTILVAARLSLGRLSATRRLAAIALLSIWCAAIGYSAMATRQHYAIDLPAGVLLAWLCYRWSWSVRAAHGLVTGSRIAVHLGRPLVFKRSAHAEAPRARVSAGPVHHERNAVNRVSATADPSRQSAGGGGPRVAAQAEGVLRTSRS